MGFEPTIRFPVYTLSKRAPSATRPSLRSAARGSASLRAGRTIVAGRSLASVVAPPRPGGIRLSPQGLAAVGRNRGGRRRRPEVGAGGLAKLPPNPHCSRTMADERLSAASRSPRPPAHRAGARHRPGGRADRDRGDGRTRAHDLPQCAGDRHRDDHQRLSGISRARLPPQSEHAGADRHRHRRRLRRGAWASSWCAPPTPRTTRRS